MTTMTCSRVMWHVARALGLVLALFLVPAWGFSVNLAWDRPTQFVDNTTATPADIGGYKVYYGSTSGTYPNVVDVGNVTTTTLASLSVTTYVVVTAYGTTGLESAPSAPELVVTPPPPPPALPRPGPVGWVWRR